MKIFKNSIQFISNYSQTMNFSETITIAKNSAQPLTVNRFGYGTMRLTGEGIYGEPPRRAEALQILKETQRTGIQFLDTADYYGDDVTNRLIAEALFPYAKDLVICSKVGATRKPDKSWVTFNRPEDLRTSIDNNLRTLKVEQMSLVHFRVMPNSTVPFKESMEAMFDLQKEGKILHVGISNATPEELTTAMQLGSVATVENMYAHAQRTLHVTPYGVSRGGEEVLAICEANEIPLIPYFSLVNSLHKQDRRIATIAEKYKATEAQINLAWLLHRSQWILPIPGTSSLAHFEENIKAASIVLSKEDMEFLA
jgi:pyridoxine 4-dehydrogenase